MTANPIPQPDAELIAEMRKQADAWRPSSGFAGVHSVTNTLDQAADRLSALVAENERLSGALVVIALGTTDQEPPFRGFDLNKAREIAATGLRVKVR